MAINDTFTRTNFLMTILLAQHPAMQIHFMIDASDKCLLTDLDLTRLLKIPESCSAYIYIYIYSKKVIG